jgi:hypothetical protein
LKALTPCAGELEWVQEIVGLLKVWPDSVDLMDEVLNADDVELTQLALHTNFSDANSHARQDCCTIGITAIMMQRHYALVHGGNM